MAYPDKPSGQYSLRDYDFAQADSKKIPMDEYLFKNGYKNAEESETESVPDAHSQNWLFDLLHRNLKYVVSFGDENKRLIQENKDLISNLDSVKATKTEVQTVKDSINTSILNTLKSLYPVGSIYLTTANTCPMTALIPGSSWTLVSSGRALWTGNGSNGNSTISAGLPNITGSVSAYYTYPSDGAFINRGTRVQSCDGYKDWNSVHAFSASSSNSIYGNSSTVQPPAYVVNAYRRVS